MYLFIHIHTHLFESHLDVKKKSFLLLSIVLRKCLSSKYFSFIYKTLYSNCTCGILMKYDVSYHMLHVGSRWEDVGSDLVVIIEDGHHVLLTDEAFPPRSVDAGRRAGFNYRTYIKVGWLLQQRRPGGVNNPSGDSAQQC